MSRAASTLRTDARPAFDDGALGEGLCALYAWTAEEMRRCETELSAVHRGVSLVDRGARHLLDLQGKRLRPLCVVLAAKLGRGFGPAACELAVSAELIHSATLLHDDVIDDGEVRRGAPATRVVFGNSASVLAGDGLLVAALRRIRRAGLPELLDGALETLDRMIAAEGVQLEHRGRTSMERGTYFEMIEGKTASLFQWALLSGAKVGGMSEGPCRALQRYGRHVGIAFQLADDLLDVAGDANVMGKAVFADLREGKMTFPLLVALEREPSLRGLIESALGRSDGLPPSRVITRLVEGLERTAAVRDTLALARRHADEAVAGLAGLDDGPGRRALVTVARAAFDRGR